MVGWIGALTAWVSQPVPLVVLTMVEPNVAMVPPPSAIVAPSASSASSEEEAPADAQDACALQRQQLVAARYRELAEGPFKRGIVPLVAWDEVEPRPEEQPERAEARIAAWTKRCLEPDAWVSVRCEEYPCAFAFDSDAVRDPSCLKERWSGLDRDWSPGVDSRLSMRYVYDLPPDETVPENIQRRRRPRSNFFVGDHVGERNRLRLLRKGAEE